MKSLKFGKLNMALAVCAMAITMFGNTISADAVKRVEPTTGQTKQEAAQWMLDKYSSKYITLSPDKTAWTFEKDSVRTTQAGSEIAGTAYYPNSGMTAADVATMNTIIEIRAGRKQSTEGADTGYHWYFTERKTPYKVYKFTAHGLGVCQHSAKVSSWCGMSSVGSTTSIGSSSFSYRQNPCGQRYPQGWTAQCGDCGASIPMLFYANETNIRVLTELSATGNYFYLCPRQIDGYGYCHSLEQGASVNHVCAYTSPNRYYINYDKNEGSYYKIKTAVTGGTDSTYHLYDGSQLFEGNIESYLSNKIAVNQYYREGYEFVGWNTKADGSGTSYSSGQTITKPLTTGNNVTVTLYAQWKPLEGKLTKTDFSGTTNTTYKYGDSVKINTPAGGNYTVSFNGNGGTSNKSSIKASVTFSSWSFIGGNNGTGTSAGTFNAASKLYTNLAGKDSLTANYTVQEITLPSAERSTYRFDGWYTAASGGSYIGKAGDTFVPSKNITFYAHWSKPSFTVTAIPKFDTAHPGGFVVAGYLASNYDFTALKRGTTVLNNSANVNPNSLYDNTFGPCSLTTWTVPYDGIYTITIYGAQGADNGSHVGGKGGKVQVKVSLKTSDTVKYYVASKPSTLATGGKGSYVTINGKQIAAGGGGAASSKEAGGAGGNSSATSINGTGSTSVPAVYHYHKDSGCYEHSHTGSATAGTGCYNGGAYTAGGQCGAPYGGTEHNKCGWYWESQSENASAPAGGWCRRCHGTNRDSVHDDSYCTEGHYHNVESGGTCRASVSGRYALNCGIGVPWSCGLSDGELIKDEDIVAGVGGKNYLEATTISVTANESGKRSGNGAITIKCEKPGLTNSKNFTTNDYPATDKAAPDKPVAKLYVDSDTSAYIEWAAPKDNGSTYTYDGYSYDSAGGSETKRASASATVTSGVKGYYVKWDTSATTTVNNTNGTYQTGLKYTGINPSNLSTTYYLHIAAVDNGGNIGGTTHVKVVPIEKYKATFDKNGGSFTSNGSGGTVTSGGVGTTANLVKEYKNGTKLNTLPVVTREGYNFLYWLGDDGIIASPDYIVTKNVKFTAQWEQIKYTVTLDPKMGHITGDGKNLYTVIIDSTQNNVVNKAALEGYSFQGWYITVNNVEKQVFDKNGKYIGGDYWTSDGKWKYKGNITVYAKYTPIEYSIRYTKGATNIAGDDRTQSARYNEDVTTYGNTFTGRGYTLKFNGNRPTDMYGNYTVGTPQSVPATQAGNLLFDKWGISATNNSGDYYQNTLYVKPNFEPNGGTAVATALWLPKELSWGNPTLIGYKFVGWYVDAAGTNVYKDALNDNNKMVVAPSTTALNKTIYAKWEPLAVNYKVNHWIQNVTAGSDAENSSNFTLYRTQTFTALADSYVTPDTLDPGYEYVIPAKKTVRVEADGSTVVDYYYLRHKVMLRVDGEYLDKFYDNLNGLCTFDVYINGKLVANDVTDYYNDKILYGSTWLLDDIKYVDPKKYNGDKVNTSNYDLPIGN